MGSIHLVHRSTDNTVADAPSNPPPFHHGEALRRIPWAVREVKGCVLTVCRVSVLAQVSTLVRVHFLRVQLSLRPCTM
jgi:hypothetical protein